MLFVVTVTIQTIEAAIGPGHDQQLGRSTSRGQPAGLIQIIIFSLRVKKANSHK
jgi:hypothetical protein